MLLKFFYIYNQLAQQVNLESQFRNVFDTIDMVFDAVNSNFSSFLFKNKRISNKDECFKILFLSVYQLMNDGYVIFDYKSVANSIKDSTDLFDKFTASGRVDYQKAGNAVNNLYKLLKPAFSKKIEKAVDKLQVELDTRLSCSKIEMQMTEFKIGISDFEMNEVNMECIHRIAKTLVAMANTNNGRNKVGYVIIGIANTRESYKDWFQVYGEQANIMNQHYVPGIACEEKKLFHKSNMDNLDEYLRLVRRLLSKEPISHKLKNYVLENIFISDYHDVDLVVIQSRNVGEASLYDNKKYVRNGNETVVM